MKLLPLRCREGKGCSRSPLMLAPRVTPQNEERLITCQPARVRRVCRHDLWRQECLRRVGEQGLGLGVVIDFKVVGVFVVAVFIC